MTRHTLFQELMGTLGVLWVNDQVKCIVVDRGSGVHMAAYSLSWSELVERIQNGLDPKKYLIVGGPIEAEDEEPIELDVDLDE